MAYFHKPLALAAVMTAFAATPIQAATYIESFNDENDTLAGAEEILAGDLEIIGYRGLGAGFLDDESIDFYRFDFLSQGLVLLLDLTIDQADGDAFRTPPTMDLYVANGDTGHELLSSSNLVSTGSFISWLVDIAGPIFLGVRGTAYDPDFDIEPPLDTNLSYTVGVQVVPVPAAVWMLGSALAATGLAARRRT